MVNPKRNRRLGNTYDACDRIPLRVVYVIVKALQVRVNTIPVGGGITPVLSATIHINVPKLALVMLF